LSDLRRGKCDQLDVCVSEFGLIEILEIILTYRLYAPTSSVRLIYIRTKNTSAILEHFRCENRIAGYTRHSLPRAVDAFWRENKGIGGI
jgi:hypothetical protein